MEPPAAIKANPTDTVAIAIGDVPVGTLFDGVTIIEHIPAGHKFALTNHCPGEQIIKLGQPIGEATAVIASGMHVHSHNLAYSGHLTQRSARKNWNAPQKPGGSFRGFMRSNGTVGIRNFVGILSTVNCSATVAKAIAAHFTVERMAEWPNVDGVVAFTHISGCGMAQGGAAIANLRATMAGYANNPNVAGTLVIGLGCEVNQIDDLSLYSGPDSTVKKLIIQEEGGTRAAIEAGIAKVIELLATANKATRQLASPANLTIGLQCGASDGYSALTANPVLGAFSDLIVSCGGKVILSETPEIYGAEEMLLARTTTAEVAELLATKIAWWEQYANQDGASLDNNPSPGNKVGGITTILEKSLGAIAKAGGSALNDVVDYGRPVTRNGLTFMDTPGYDPCSATGQIAGGANLIIFTTGRGSTFGSKPSPTFKLASNAKMATAMAEDIDFDCSPVLEGVSIQTLGEMLFQEILEFASGKRSASEVAGLGDHEFVPWLPGATY